MQQNSANVLTPKIVSASATAQHPALVPKFKNDNEQGTPRIGTGKTKKMTAVLITTKSLVYGERKSE